MQIQLREQPFDPWQELHAYHESLQAAPGTYGATSVFVGTMRDINESDTVQSMYLEHYPEMTSRYLEKIANEAAEQWEVLDTLILHRVGHIRPDDAIVLIATWSAHRDVAFKACRFIIEELKHRAPFWKKEILDDNTQRWVSNNTPASK
ncbi:MAG: molybdenum cofactor biosynthesis protein MoaE [Gammaproteobacteria bacterium]|jgi:molybdopterin synthase catalytic subunit